MTTSTPLLALVMIVKNEARGLAETLASIRPFIDCWTILDTGSTDGTQDVIRQALADVPGQLHEEPFVDFATSRNRVIELHGTQTQFVVMLSGDDILQGGEQLRNFLEISWANACAEIYNLERQIGGDRFMSAIVIRTGTSWRYVGRTHEALYKLGHVATECVPGVQVIRRAVEQKRGRWELDLVLLTEDLTQDPTNTRTAFYLAQTLECLGRLAEARDAYRHRVKLGGWVDETYEAMFRIARVMEALGQPWPEVQQAYLDAYGFDPRRAEPLVAVADYYRRTDQMALCYLFASRAFALNYPDTRLFVDAAVYEWKAADLVAISAYYVGRRLGDRAILDKGRRAADAALRARQDDPRLRANRAFYETAGAT